MVGGNEIWNPIKNHRSMVAIWRCLWIDENRAYTCVQAFKNGQASIWWAGGSRGHLAKSILRPDKAYNCCNFWCSTIQRLRSLDWYLTTSLIQPWPCSLWLPCRSRCGNDNEVNETQPVLLSYHIVYQHQRKTLLLWLDLEMVAASQLKWQIVAIRVYTSISKCVHCC